ncbi:sel1 repeat family protein [Cupriavidus campinensis]|uniref:Sel1 repeat family protein n=1 Tax=Cupriavidus campinensis TaxID=151783 RepID=A0AAE9I5B1_9BURK|nr:sel1 repeat family protein [Cupriavidus campinensis]URF07667.1 sel1 repeat family protein [Cupriavidus campinensis]
MRTVPDLASVRANLAFECVHEAARLPDLDPEADAIFRYARHLEKRRGPKDFDEVARYYRIAAAHGHYKANNNLQQLVSHGLASSPLAQKESVDLAAQLIAEGVPSGYYDIGYYLNLGYGLKQDREMALRYFRKAADLGNANAQAYVAGLLDPLDKAPDIARRMRQCATDHGHRDAANTLGIDLQIDQLYPEATIAYQKGVAAGNSVSALVLEYGFKPVPPEDMDYLALPPDPERSRRYKEIGKFLDRYDGQNPKLPDIDKIVPLPPAKLPPWDGTFQWQKEQEAAEPPPKPSDELILRLCKAKNLDPATGLAIPRPPKAALGTQAKPPYITQSRPIPTPISALARLGCAARCSTLRLQGNAEARLGLRLRNNNRETRSTPWVSAPFFSLF